MTLEEAIKHQKELEDIKRDEAAYIKSKMKSNIALENAEERIKCADEYHQLAEWLKELQRWHKNKEAILQAGNQGKEVQIYIGGRLFAVRELAQ